MNNLSRTSSDTKFDQNKMFKPKRVIKTNNLKSKKFKCIYEEKYSERDKKIQNSTMIRYTSAIVDAGTRWFS